MEKNNNNLNSDKEGTNEKVEKLINKINFSIIKILSVDDCDITQMITGKYFSKFGGSKITKVINGKLAIEAVKNNDFDIILMDRNMPVMGGDEATEEIKKIKPQIPIISVTATPKGTEKFSYDDFLTKPFNQKELLEILEKNIIKYFLKTIFHYMT